MQAVRREAVHHEAVHQEVLAEEAAPARSRASLLDWRRQVADLYAELRRLPGAEGWMHWRATRDRLFRDHPQSPLTPAGQTRHRGIACFPYDPALRFTVGLAPLAGGGKVAADGGRDGAIAMTPFATTDGLGERLGGELTLYWIEGYGGGVFLPFGDATNGRETYGGGRYLLDTVKSADLGADAEGRLILDFNFAYYPSCAYSDEWICPLPPRENRLDVAVRAGERDEEGAG
jgi:hypothetical protein